MTRSLNESNGELDVFLAESIRATDSSFLELRENLADMNRNETVVVAVAVDRERISKEVFEFDQGLRTKLIVEISLQILFYDMADGTLAENIPISAAIA